MTSKSDVFSYGVVLFELFSCGDNPWAGFNNDSVIAELRKGNRMPIPESFEFKFIVKLINQCWQEESDQRPTFQVFFSFFLFFSFHNLLFDSKSFPHFKIQIMRIKLII